MLKTSTLDFFRDLRQNNNKEWFDSNRKRYESVKTDYLRLAESLLTEMKKYDETLDILTPKDCTFRINKDIRFSKDKSPYKTNLGIALHPYGKKMQLAAYYIHIEEGQSFAGGGLWRPEAPLLSKVRKEIHYFYSEFNEIISSAGFIKTYGHIDDEENQKLSRPPKGYQADDPAIEYLKLKSFTASIPIDDYMLISDKCIKETVNHLRTLKPFINFINRGLMSDDAGGL